jgi:hypothetical protein
MRAAASIRAAAAKCPDDHHLTDDLKCVPIPVASPEDLLAVESQRLGRALIACRALRRDQLCEHSRQMCAAIPTFSMNGTSMTEEEHARCTFDCKTGDLYMSGLDSVFAQVRQTNDRKTQIKIVYVALAGCASGRDLESTHVPLPSMDIH